MLGNKEEGAPLICSIVAARYAVSSGEHELFVHIEGWNDSDASGVGITSNQESFIARPVGFEYLRLLEAPRQKRRMARDALIRKTRAHSLRRSLRIAERTRQGEARL